MLEHNSKHLEIKYCQIKDTISRYNFWQSKQICDNKLHEYKAI